MCVARIQRLMMAIVLGFALYFFTVGIGEISAGAQQSTSIMIAVILQSFVIFMILLWAFTNFCPSIWLLKKVFPLCEWEK